MQTLQVIRWDGPADLRDKLLGVLVEDLGLDSPEDTIGFERACGGSEYEGHMYFWRARDGEPGRRQGDRGVADPLAGARPCPRGS